MSLDGLNLSTRRKIESDGATHLEEKKILKNLQKMILHVDLTKPAPQDKEKKEKVLAQFGTILLLILTLFLTA